MTAFSHDIGGAVEAYAAYLNAPRGILDSEEQVLFDEDLARARAAMERAWLESTPVRSSETNPARDVPRFLVVLSTIMRAARRALARA